MQSTLNSVMDRVSKNEEDIENLQRSVEITDEKYKKLEILKYENLQQRVDNLEKKTSDELMRREIRDRKQNRLFYGVQQEQGECVYQVVKDFLVSDFGVPNDEINGIAIVNAHRLPRRKMETEAEVQQKGEPKPDPIIVKFGCMETVPYSESC